MTQKRCLLLCGDSIYMQSIGTSLQGLADVEISYLGGDMESLKGAIQQAPPHAILLDHPQTSSPAGIPLDACISLVAENRIPLILINKNQQTFTLLSGSSHPAGTLEDLMSVIDNFLEVPNDGQKIL
jgi:hypothetical protein